MVGPSKGREFIILDKRSVGWFKTKEEAQKCVDKNYGDIFECGSYPYAVIEEIPWGLYPYCKESWWFKWSGSRKTGKYIPIEKPAKNVINFAIG
jgi:hypothetical protein